MDPGSRILLNSLIFVIISQSDVMLSSLFNRMRICHNMYSPNYSDRNERTLVIYFPHLISLFLVRL